MSASDDAAAGEVGPVLHAGHVADAIVAAMQQERPDLRVVDRGAYLRLIASAPLRLDRVAVENELGAAFVLPGDLEAVMSSFAGHLRVGDDEVVWEAWR